MALTVTRELGLCLHLRARTHRASVQSLRGQASTWHEFVLEVFEYERLDDRPERRERLLPDVQDRTPFVRSRTCHNVEPFRQRSCETFHLVVIERVGLDRDSAMICRAVVQKTTRRLPKVSGDR